MKGWRKFILAVIIGAAMVLVGYTAEDAATAHEIVMGLAAVFTAFAAGNGIEHWTQKKKEQ